jgi:hypothetical protein
MAESSVAKLASQFKAMPRKQQLGVMFAVPVLIAGVFGYLAWKDLLKLGPDERVPTILQRKDGNSLGEQIASLNDEIAAKNLVIAQMPDVQRQLADLQDDIEAAENKLPKEAEKALMREVIQRLAREIPADIGVVKVKSVRISEDDSGRSAGSTGRGELRSLTFQTEILGDINGIIKFIDRIEKNDRFMTVNAISLRSGDVAADLSAQDPKPVFTPHQVRLDVVTYVYAGSSRKGGK